MGINKQLGCQYETNLMFGNYSDPHIINHKAA